MESFSFTLKKPTYTRAHMNTRMHLSIYNTHTHTKGHAHHIVTLCSVCVCVSKSLLDVNCLYQLTHITLDVLCNATFSPTVRQQALSSLCGMARTEQCQDSAQKRSAATVGVNLLSA